MYPSEKQREYIHHSYDAGSCISVPVHGDCSGGRVHEINATCVQTTVSIKCRQMFMYEDIPLYNITPASDGPSMIPLCALYAVYILLHVTNRTRLSPTMLHILVASITARISAVWIVSV